MVIQIDTRQQIGKKHHQIKEQWFIDNGHSVVHSKCLVGDYICPSNGSVAVDTKQSVSELYSNLIQDHARFRNECIKARDCGIKLIVLVENEDGLKKPEDIMTWDNPLVPRYRDRASRAIKNGKEPPKEPASNVRLYRIMRTMEDKYGVVFRFCNTEDAGRKIVKYLGG